MNRFIRWSCLISVTLISLVAASNAGAGPVWPVGAPKASIMSTQGTGDSEPANIVDILNSNMGAIEKVQQAVILCPLRYLYVVKQATGLPSVVEANSQYKLDPDILKTCSVLYDPSKAAKLMAAKYFACRYAQCHKADEDEEVSTMAAKINDLYKCQEEDIPAEKCPVSSNFAGLIAIASNEFPGFGSFFLMETGLVNLMTREGLSLSNEASLAKGIYITGAWVQPFLTWPRGYVEPSVVPALPK